jgi:hypothetical protein
MGDTIQVGTSNFDKSDFIIAVQDELGCKDCGHCAINLKPKDRYHDYTCYHDSAQQTGYYSSTAMNVAPNFLCNRFEFGLDTNTTTPKEG